MIEAALLFVLGVLYAFGGIEVLRRTDTPERTRLFERWTGGSRARGWMLLAVWPVSLFFSWAGPVLAQRLDP